MTSVGNSVLPALAACIVRSELLILLPEFQSVVQPSKNTTASFIIKEENDNNNSAKYRLHWSSQ